MKVIPAIDIMGSNVVRLVQGNPKNKTVYSSNPVETAKKWEKAGADMLHLVDLDATLGIGSNFQMIKNIAENVSIPIEVAGGLRTQETIENVLHFASKAVLGTIAFKNKEILQKISEKFGKDRIIISADQLNGKIVIDGWKENTGIELIQGLESFVRLGYSEFLITSVERDGTLQGPDLDSLRKACSVQNTRIIASGGISSLQDTISVKKCGVSSVILGKALYDGKISIEKVKTIA
ncbi:MAG: 1-(5-phosphoribosyl)-5-[(5-phosphoribosylamino)methylideneamino]imidazole-4-carboxamide isomerase [Thaumarchaeota archaeon 13_1_40CM_4_38_7]|nr:MAG: 1-(5-phosphoribosyl)-5-[(5-phosphoribosylamino)methylideneamino]imidazole-4-carboxamide isomerase [Thaumarchaeota archaeon 13_1_40CM_4_38_7]OLC91935.1 MAG: 1-(5-phosphoribosyl)-5-[(5-phosphoribosylamino)methylideneamino]imidazole-4-carboxamide isomerase [Thaumarchaeota archaeon 13_1_40CM_3_38_6]